jgi:hypothetical protein
MQPPSGLGASKGVLRRAAEKEKEIHWVAVKAINMTPLRGFKPLGWLWRIESGISWNLRYK